MSTFLYSPMSPRTGTNFSFVEGTSVCDFVHLPTALDVEEHASSKARESDSYATYTPQTHTYYQPTRLLSPSEPSTARLQLQRSNVRLLELLESVQEELNKQRILMRNIHNRVSTLELESDNNTATRFSPVATPTTLLSVPQTRNKSPAKSASLLPESRAWWEACQNFAHNCDSPFNATDFLATPKRLSELQFDFNFDDGGGDDVQTVAAPLATPIPELHDVPGLTPESDDDENIEYPAMALSPPGDIPITRPRAVTFPWAAPSGTSESDIVERVVEFSHVKIPRPPILQSPPRSLKSKASVLMLGGSEEEITALPPMSPREPTPVVECTKKGGHRKIKSLFMVKTLLKGKMEREDECGSKRLYLYR
ncbi:hypothetical protein NX059_010611 [Plenodomus lindquistii]|nr:hypothetical protein NX059_010611 [Plenodomus lindquistii]